jgi:cysteine desulfuration protein SufE
MDSPHFSERQRVLLAAWAEPLDVHERLTALVERAAGVPRFTLDERIPAHRVPGCATPVWIVGSLDKGVVRVRGDAESPVVRGLVIALCAFYDGESVETIQAVEPVWWETLGLWRELSPTRRHGLEAVRRRIVTLATSLVSPS